MKSLLNRKLYEEPEYIPTSRSPEHMSLDELFEIAATFGELETGGVRTRHGAEIRVSNVDGDWIRVRSEKCETLKQNIAECITKARAVRDLYKSMGWT